MLAYYAHSHGYGHSNSAQEFCKIFNEKSLIITSSKFKFDDGLEIVHVCSEDMEYDEYLKNNFNLPGYAHYLPKRNNSILFRNFQILECCLAENIKLAFVDVSVETAIHFRISGIPYAYNKMLGMRDDLPHQLAYEASEFLFAYYPKQMEHMANLKFQSKTHYLGFISRFKYRPNLSLEKLDFSNVLSILILIGNGGTSLSLEIIKSICSQKANYFFTTVGYEHNLKLKNLKQVEFTNDLESLMIENDIVISSCGMNLTAEILAVKNKFIAFPEERPYDEQNQIMQGLIEKNLAVELNLKDLNQSILKYLELPLNKDLESFFGSMSDFKKIKELKPYL